jgi:hypothetical protein
MEIWEAVVLLACLICPTVCVYLRTVPVAHCCAVICLNILCQPIYLQGRPETTLQAAKQCAKHASTLLLATLLAALQQKREQRRPMPACKAAHACNAVKPPVLCAPSNPCRQLALNDAIMRHLSGPTLVQPTVIVALALGSLYASFICFAQSVRLYVHTVRAAHV